MDKKFSISEALSSSWEILKDKFWFIFSLQIIMLVIRFFPEAMNFIFKDRPEAELLLLVIAIIFFILQLVANIGMTKIFLGLHDKDDSREVADLFSGVNYLSKYVMASVLYGAIVLVGLVLFIIPGIIWSIKYQFITYFIIDKDMGVMDALRASAGITENRKMDLFVFSCIVMLVNLAGLLALGIGLFVTVPLTFLAVVHIYRKLSAGQESEVQSVPEAVQGQI